jgi:hypothetical protein
MSQEKQDQGTTSETDATCGSKSAVERLVSGHLPRFALSDAATKRIVQEWADHEELKVRGKTLATSVGHPEWENACLRCGEVEIPIDQKECKRCTVRGLFDR